MWLSQAQAPDVVGQWVQYGVLGSVVVSLIVGWLWPKPPVDRIIEENQALRRRLEQCQEERQTELRKLRQEVKALAERMARDP